ncbi:MAG: MCE family protein [Alphaproteobacteria bacterium]|nr:MCE family protein [Alphaproteobacteria bacterium]
METRAHHITVGAFVLIILAAVLASIVWLARLQFQREGSIYDINFRGSVNGLSEGAPVRYKGVPIGRVLTIKLAPENVERIRVRIAVDSNAPIKQDAVASLELQGITGQAYVQISGGSNASPPLKATPDRTYPLIMSRPSQLEEVVTSAPELLNRAIRVADRLAEVLSQDNEEAVTRTLHNLDSLTGTFVKDGEQVDRLVAAGADALADLRATVAAANGLLAHTDQALNQKNGIVERLNATLEEFGRSAKTLGQVTDHLDGVLQENRPALREFTQRGLTQAEQLVADSRSLIASLNRIADEIQRDPSRFLYGDRREGYHPR